MKVVRQLIPSIGQNGAYIAFALALAASLASLGLSEILGLPPCVLCWYQRICMYPLVVIIGVGILRRSRDLVAMAAPLVVIGWGIALYHSLLQWNILPEAAAPCRAGVSCTTVHINLLGFMTIPFGSLVAFTAIGVVLYLYQKEQTRVA